MVVDTYPASEKPLQVDEEDIELEDYTDLNLASKDIVQLIQSKKDEKEALNILKTRAAENYYRNHPDQAFESSLPPNYVTFYPHKCTQVEILDHNNNFTYYITLEHYEHGHGLEHNNDGFANKPFAIYTLRSSAQNKCVKHFCKAHSPSQTPGNASPIENIEWEVRGAGDKTVKDIAVVDGDVVTVEKVIKGEKVSLTKRNETKRREGKGRGRGGRLWMMWQKNSLLNMINLIPHQATKTGRLSVTIPGGHTCHFYNRDEVSSFVASSNPLYYN